MVGKWKVTSTYIGNEKMYAVYRLKNTAELDHSGNREIATGYSSNRQEQMDIAAKLNQESA